MIIAWPLSQKRPTAGPSLPVHYSLAKVWWPGKKSTHPVSLTARTELTWTIIQLGRRATSYTQRRQIPSKRPWGRDLYLRLQHLPPDLYTAYKHGYYTPHDTEATQIPSLPTPSALAYAPPSSHGTRAHYSSVKERRTSAAGQIRLISI